MLLWLSWRSFPLRSLRISKWTRRWARQWFVYAAMLCYDDKSKELCMLSRTVFWFDIGSYFLISAQLQLQTAHDRWPTKRFWLAVRRRVRSAYSGRSPIICRRRGRSPDFAIPNSRAAYARSVQAHATQIRFSCPDWPGMHDVPAVRSRWGYTICVKAEPT